MLKKIVNYTDFDNNQRSETLYFNMTQTELVEFAMDLPDGVTSTVAENGEMDEQQAAMAMIEKLGGKGVMGFIKNLLLKSYGVKSEDGRRFIKSAALSEEFSQTLAFDAIFMELMGNDKAASDFVNGVIPAAVIEKMPMMRNTTPVIPVK